MCRCSPPTFSQSDPVTQKAAKHGIPNRDTQRILRLSDDGYLWLVKLMFGDPRAPRFWCERFVGELRKLKLLQHALAKASGLRWTRRAIWKAVSAFSSTM